MNSRFSFSTSSMLGSITADPKIDKGIVNKRQIKISSSNKKFIENCEDITHNNIPVDIAELPRGRSWLKESRGGPVSKSRSSGVKEYL